LRGAHNNLASCCQQCGELKYGAQQLDTGTAWFDMHTHSSKHTCFVFAAIMGNAAMMSAAGTLLLPCELTLILPLPVMWSAAHNNKHSSINCQCQGALRMGVCIPGKQEQTRAAGSS
jgi:hypothetical protein